MLLPRIYMIRKGTDIWILVYAEYAYIRIYICTKISSLAFFLLRNISISVCLNLHQL